MNEIVLKSKEDASVNFITPCNDGGYFESRYVRRTDDKLAVYLSSQSGCNKGCKFCHLTATKQTMFTQASLRDYLDQAEKVGVYYSKLVTELNLPRAKYVHYNFMSRGEPLANTSILEQSDTVLMAIHKLIFDNSSKTLPKYNISTIMPKGLDRGLEKIFKFVHPTIYYSLYSLNKDFRKKWLPSAMPPESAIRMLKEYQYFTNKIVRIHGTFIKGENDDLGEVGEMFDLIQDYKLRVGFNLVRYNPYDEEAGKESSNLCEISTLIKDRVGEDNFKEVSRVGRDVQASCGTFYSGDV